MQTARKACTNAAGAFRSACLPVQNFSLQTARRAGLLCGQLACLTEQAIGQPQWQRLSATHSRSLVSMRAAAEAVQADTGVAEGETYEVTV
jgi:hypothetical protein